MQGADQREHDTVGPPSPGALAPAMRAPRSLAGYPALGACRAGLLRCAHLRRTSSQCRCEANYVTRTAVDAIYFDESIHRDHGFISGAYVFVRESLDNAIAAALRQAGMQPGRDEFKSRLPFAVNPHFRRLRDELMRLVQSSTSIGLLVAPERERARLGAYALDGLVKIVEANRISSQSLQVYMDEGLFSSRAQARRLLSARPSIASCGLHPEQDSGAVFGIQLADLVANAGARILIENLTGEYKLVDIGGENTGYELGTEAELEWTLRMMLRYSFFKGPLRPEQAESEGVEAPLANLFDYAIHIAPGCPEPVAEVARTVFDTIWLGCIH